jgi:two-component system sensor histidine kinase DegS
LETRVEERTAELADANERLLAEREMLRQLLDKQERERKILAYEIHDGLVQYAIATQIQLEVAEKRAQTDLGAARAALKLARQHARNSIEEGRRLISGLRPPILDEHGIVEAIDYLLHENQWPPEMVVEFEAPATLRDLAPETATTLFRIAQEALTNVRRHSRANRLRVQLEELDANGHAAAVRLEVRDWGIGFEYDAERPGNFGLRGIRDRVKLHDGAVQFNTRLGAGTQVIVTLPVGGGSAARPGDNPKDRDNGEHSS